MQPPETDVAAFAADLRTGGLVVLDVREAADFAAWHLDAPGNEVVNVPVRLVMADPGRCSGMQSGGPLRVICARGNASRHAVAALTAAGVPATNVIGGMIAWARILTPEEIPVAGPARIVQLRRQARGCLSYLVSSAGEALVVDPGPDIAAYLALAAEHRARITRVLDTHVHADHLSGARALVAATGAILHLSPAALERGFAADAVEAAADGARLPLGEADVVVLALPGHTTDNTGLVIDGGALIAGDSLFADSIARPDLQVGDDGALAAARALHATIHDRILPLGDEVVLLPCHYAGGPLDGPIAPRLRDVRAAVALLLLDADRFAHDLIAAMPPRPGNYREIIACNLGGMGAQVDPSGLEVGANNCAATVPSA